MWYYIIPAWLISLIAIFILGYDWRNMKKTIENLEETVKSKVDKPVKLEEPKSMLIDPTDEVQEALYERQKLMERLNPPQ